MFRTFLLFLTHPGTGNHHPTRMQIDTISYLCRPKKSITKTSKRMNASSSLTRKRTWKDWLAATPVVVSRIRHPCNRHIGLSALARRGYPLGLRDMGIAQHRGVPRGGQHLE